jgi:hypothetical protein
MLMKRNFTQGIFGAFLILSVSAGAQDSLFISELADPADDYAGRFIELYNAGSQAIDFGSASFYLSRQSNGGTSWGDLQLTGTVAPGKTFVIGGSGFEALFGFAPDQVTGILTGNGDDAYALFTGGDHSTGVLHDLYGVIDTDGTGEPWEYEDSRAVRVDSILVPNPVWNGAEWEIMPADLADCDPGTHLGSGGTVPAGDYALAVLNDTVNWGVSPELRILVNELLPEDQVISFQFDVNFDTEVLEYTGISLDGTLSEGGTVAVNDGVSGRLSIGYMRTAAITGAGDLLHIRFNALSLDTTVVALSNAYLNSVPVADLVPGTLIIHETAPPTAVITYSDSVNRFADTLLITAIFSEEMDPGIPVLLSMDGAVTLQDAAMTRLGASLYNYSFPVPGTGGEVYIMFSGGTDLWGNEVVARPESGGSFQIIPFHPGDVDDDGIILAYDAALTLRYSVGMDPLPEADPMPWEPWRDSTANVDGEGGITAHDAGLILRYSAGLITGFPESALKSGTGARMTVALKEGCLVFYSHGELLGFNLDVASPAGMLGDPVILNDRFLSAVNISDDRYRVGLCTAVPAGDGEAVLKIPCTGPGQVLLHMMHNTTEQSMQLDLETYVTGPEAGGIRMYPNPARDRLYVNGPGGPYRVRILSMHGQQLLSVRLQGDCGEIDLSVLEPGIYLVTVENGDVILTRRLVKE